MISTPTEWTLKSLGEVAAKVPYAIVDGPFGSNMKSSDYVASGVPVLQGKNITNDSFRWFDIRYLSNEKAIELKRSSVRVDDILMVKIGSIGYAAVVDSLSGHDYAIIPANLVKITPNKELIDTRYLFRWLTSPNSKRYFQSNASKTAQPALSLSKIKALPISAPPLPEQRRIAAILDQAYVLKAKRREVLERLDSLTQSIFIDMFGDSESNHKGMTIVQLGDVTTKITDGTHLTPKFISSGVPFIFVKNFQNGYIDFETDKFISEAEHAALYKRCPIEPGDVLYTTVGATYGQAATVGKFTKFAFQRHVAHLKPDAMKVLPEFLGMVMQQPFIKRQADRWARGAAQPTVNLTELRKFEIPLPALDKQSEFVKKGLMIDRMKQAQKASLDQFEPLLASLQHRAFRGEL